MTKVIKSKYLVRLKLVKVSGNVEDTITEMMESYDDYQNSNRMFSLLASMFSQFISNRKAKENEEKRQGYLFDAKK